MSKIIGQERIVKELSRIFDIFKISEGQIRPHFILTGDSVINTLINQYFIKGGELGFEDVKEITFQEKLSLK